VRKRFKHAHLLRALGNAILVWKVGPVFRKSGEKKTIGKNDWTKYLSGLSERKWKARGVGFSLPSNPKRKESMTRDEGPQGGPEWGGGEERLN